jgi:hypothetical protein
MAALAFFFKDRQDVAVERNIGGAQARRENRQEKKRAAHKEIPTAVP